MYKREPASVSLCYNSGGAGVFFCRRKEIPRVMPCRVIAVHAPARVAKKFTISLLHQGRPRRRRVCVLQEGITRSVSHRQIGQKYIAWTVAPSRLSHRLPACPLSREIAGRSARDLCKPCVAQRTRPNVHAPSAEATRPGRVMPPEVPGATVRPLVIRRGSAWLSTPSSVAQVSAVAVASAPAKPTSSTC